MQPHDEVDGGSEKENGKFTIDQEKEGVSKMKNE